MRRRLLMKGLNLIILMMGILVLLPGLALTQEAKQGKREVEGRKVIRLDEVVVSATRSEIPVFDAPQSVTVISSEEIMASPL